MSLYLQIALDLGLAWLAGSLIGLEREFRGRPAGLRTHALVCVASALLMLATIHQTQWVQAAGLDPDLIRTDPTRMAQGIMTGIGFLGGGVIFKEGLSIRGLTTAASVWITAAIGILIGVGFRMPAAFAAAIAIATLAVFRALEQRVPTQHHAHLSICFARTADIGEAALARTLAEHGFTIAGTSHRLHGDGTGYEYQMIIHTLNRDSVGRLAGHLRRWDAVKAFELGLSGD